MPARDPATTPHLTNAQSPVLPTHGHILSPSSSTFSRTTSVEYGSLADTPGLAARILRRVSADKGVGPSSNGDPGASGIENRHNDEAPTSPTANLSTSSQAIRDSSNRLASLSFSRPRRVSETSMTDGGVTGISPLSRLSHPSTAVDHRPAHPSHLKHPADSPISEEISPPKGFTPGSTANVGRSGLSILMAQQRQKYKSSPPVPIASSPGPSDDGKTPLARPTILPSGNSSELDLSGEVTPTAHRQSLAEHSEEPEDNDSSALRRYLEQEVITEDLEGGNERTPLLGNSGNGSGKPHPLMRRIHENVGGLRNRMNKLTARDVAEGVILEPIKTLPSVILGLLLNVLDGVSYGMILFPANAAFVDFGSLGVSMFFVSCIVSQLTFSLGGSIFPGGNGSMMIEAVPFFHILVNIIENEVGDDTTSIIATTMVSFAFSSILTGLVFFALGAFRLGTLIGYFPRHILVGCIGGVGIFLIETGLEVSRGLKEDGFAYNLATLKLFFESTHAIALWTLPLALAIILRIITHFYHHQLIFPAYFFVIPIVFYITVAIGGWDLGYLREMGWVFDVGQNTQAWWKFYTLFDFGKTNWTAFWAAMPTQLALVFFGILHVPLNVPALGVSLSEDNVKLDRELIAHGFSNFAAGLTGTVPNYLTYVNTVLFYRVGGGSRLSGIMLAAGTAGIMFVGPTVIGYLPVTLVGALIYVLGLDLAIEAVWDTRNRVNRSEYITIWAIAIGMTLWDFVIGLLFGIILACIFFVVQNSRRRAIRAVFSGATAKSTVRRPRSQRSFIQQVGSQTYVMKLQGFLFFGTITTVEGEIRKLLEMALWQHNPIRFLIMDLTLVHGLDFSSAEAFVRVQRLLSAKDVLMIICGAAPNGPCGPALQAVGLWADKEGSRVEVFAGLNDALEWTENAYLTAFYENTQKASEAQTARTIDFPKVAKPPFSLAESFQNSPRRTHLAKAGDDTLPRNLSSLSTKQEVELEEAPQPVPLLMQTFGGYMDHPSNDFWIALSPYFVQTIVNAGQTLWDQGAKADGLYVIEIGSLRATYQYSDHRRIVQETMVAGTVAGDLSLLSDTTRNATVVAERDCVLWKMDREGLEGLENENPEVAREFIQAVLRAVAEEQDVLASHLIAVLS